MAAPAAEALHNLTVGFDQVVDAIIIALASGCPIEDSIIVAYALPPLVALLSSDQPNLQASAVAVLGNLAAGF